MKTPTLEEVKEYFKNAKEVRCLTNSVKISIIDFETIHYDKRNDKHYWVNEDYISIWSDIYGYAEIISYKDEMLQIPKSLLLELAENNSFSEQIIKKEFPQLFEEVTGWFKVPQSYGIWLGYYENNVLKYTITDCGFQKITKIIERNLYDVNDENPATEQEVFEALKNEAVKKYKDKIFKTLLTNTEIKFIEPSHFNSKENSLWVDGYVIFKNGVWAEIIKEETYVKVPLSEIKATPNNYNLGELVRRISENY